MSIGYITHQHCQLHDMGSYHPEQPARLAAINDRLIATGLDMVLRQYDASPADKAQLLAAHDPAYVDTVFRMSPEHGTVALDGDTSMNPFSLQAARLAAGAVIQGVDMVMTGELGQVFCGVRPPGHHAERDRAMGFCLFNNIAVGAYHALNQHGLKRVAIVDFDVHHGNGTQQIFENDPSVLFVSSHQMPLYPGSGSVEETGVGNILNLPLAPGSGSAALQAAWAREALPTVDAFAPDLILVSAGFDAHERDPLAQLEAQDSDYEWLTREIMALADAHCGGRLVSILEGGYDLQGLASASRAHVEALRTAR